MIILPKYYAQNYVGKIRTTLHTNLCKMNLFKTFPRFTMWFPIKSGWRKCKKYTKTGHQKDIQPHPFKGECRLLVILYLHAYIVALSLQTLHSLFETLKSTVSLEKKAFFWVGINLPLNNLNIQMPCSHHGGV